MIEVQLIDGRIIEFPDGTSQDVITETAKKATNNKYFGVSTEELRKQPSAPFSIGDTAKAGLASLVGSAGSIASAFGADNAPAKYLQETASGIQQTLSPERQEEMRRRVELEDRASKQGVGQEIMTGLAGVAEAPIQSTVSGIASSVPALIAGAAALSVGAPAAIAGTVALVAKLAVGALQGAGEAKGNIYETVREKLMAEKGLSREEAEAQASKAQEYISANAPSIMGSAAAGMLDAVTGVESVLGKKAAGKAATRPLTAPSVTGTVVKGGIEEALPEAIQGGVGKYGENVALQNAGFDVSSFSGVAGAAARDALMGALTGAAVSPLQLSQLRKEHEEEKQRRVNEETAKIDEQIRQEQEAAQQQQAAKEQEILSQPPERVQEPENLHPIRNPLGNVSKEELQAEGIDPYLNEHIDEYRKTANLPPLKSYSIEDIVDAMPGVNPVEEQKQIDTILNSRTGYQGEPISAKDVLDQAAAREIPTDNKAFTDFLNRTTGEADIKSMSNSQLFAAFKAIQNVPQGQELEEGTSSTRFTPQQYKEAIKSLDKDLETAALSVDQVLSNIKETTGLKEDLHAASILNEAVRRGDVDREGDKVSAPTTAEKLPEGYTIQEGTFKQGEKPEGYEVVLGEDALPQIHPTEEVAQKKAEEVTKVRGQLFKQMTNQIAQQEKALQKSQDALTAMQANGQQDTVPYQKAWAKHQKLEKATNENIQKLTAQLEKINPETVPVSVRKAAARVSKKRGHTVFKGQQAISTHKTRQEAEADLLEGLTDDELASAAQMKGRRTLAAKAKAEMDRRAAPPPVKEVDPGKEFEDKFKPLLDKFGLNEVALKFQKDMKSEGEYSKAVIKIALDSANPVRVLRHESIHALKELGFFTPQQWKALEGAAKREWINTYLKGRNINGEPLEAGQQSRYDAYMNVYKGDMDAIVEEAIADAFGDFDLNKAPPGLMSAILKRLKLFFEALQNALTGAGFQTYEDVFGKVEKGELKATQKPTEAGVKYFATESEAVKTDAWLATPKERSEAIEMYDEEGFLPYISQGFLDLPVDGVKYSIQKFKPEKHLSFDTTLNVPINSDGTVTVYYHTTKADSLEINNKKVIPSNGKNRIYLTNESSGAEVLREKGNFDQITDGSTVLVYVTPDMLQVDNIYDNGRVDFYIPTAQGDFFNKKMKQHSIQKARTEAIATEFSYDDHEQRITDAINKYNSATSAEKRNLVKQARVLLKKEHNVGSLLTENGKLEKTRIGDYNLSYDGLSVASQGLGLASAQKITEKTSTCPRSAICEGLCLGETSGGNFMFGGAAAEDVGDIQKSAFRAGARMMQYLKTEALIVNPEAFAVLLQAEIDSLKKWSASTTVRQKNQETKKMETVPKDIYAPAIRLNVTSDFKPSMFRGVIDGNPDVMFYDYTKIGSDSIAPNHHLTYSSTGFGQIVDGERVFFKNKAGNYDHNWATMRDRLNDGFNVAMAFSSKSALPKFIKDEQTGSTYRVLDGDLYDARYLDQYSTEKKASGKTGVIVGLRNKAGTLSEKSATSKTGGFFVQYDPKTDGDTVLVPNQEQFKRKTIPIASAKKLSLRDTDQFKEWFGNSKIVNADGTPKVMYHGTARDISEFKPKQANAIFLTDDIKFAESFSGLSEDYMIREALSKLPAVEREALFAKADASAAQNETSPSDEVNNLAKALLPSNANIMPVYVSAQNPFDYDNKKHIDALEEYEKENRYTDRSISNDIGYIKLGSWENIESLNVQKAIKSFGFDSFYVNEGGRKNLAVYKPEQIKSATGNIGTFDKYNPDIRYNLRNSTDPAIMASVDLVTTSREEKGFIERMMDAIAPKSWSEFRAQALNRYNRLGEYDKKLAEKMGGAALYADVSAESAALFSDLGAGLTASALGVHDRNGGIPVYKNGVTTVTNLNGTVKGPVAIFAPLAKYGDPTIYQLYQFWAGAKRGKRLLADGREQTYTPAMIAQARKLEQTHPEFVTIQKEWVEYNNGLVKFLVDTGVLSKDKADEFTRYSDYVPFYRQMDGENTIGPNIFQAISGVKAPKKLKGSEAPLADFLETVVRNTQSSIQMGIKNVAAQRAANVATKIGEATRLNHVASGPDVFVVMENGKQVYYRSGDPLFINAIKSLNLPDLPFIGLLAAPANVLRNLVTKDPGFMLANMVRDSMSAYLTSGAKMTPIASTISNFGKAIAGSSPEYNALLNAGLLGGYEFSSNVEQSGKTMQEALRIKAGIKNKKDYVTGVWQALEKGTTASDAATRMEIYKSTMAETGNEAEALFRAMEVMNFNRKGSSAVIRLLTAAVPFLNARMQGLDVLYRTAFGANATANAKEMQRAFFVRGMTMFALSCMYWSLTHDDDDYKKQEQETKDNYWLIPALGIKIPTPFEVAIPFKVIPERIMALSFGTDTAKDFRESMTRQLVNTLAFNPIPQTALPLVEVVTNHSFFTGRDIIGQGMQDIAKEFQVGPNTSLLSQKIGAATGLSPMQLDHIIKGYTGTMGMYAVDVIDGVLDVNNNSPKVSKRFEQLPVIRRFALDPEARGAVTAYYDLKNSVDQTTRTINLLERTGNFEAMGEYYKDNMNLLASKDYISDLEKDMKEIREMKVMVRSSSMSGDEKRDALTSLNRMENQLTANIQEIRKFALK